MTSNAAEVAKTLIELGADVNHRDAGGNTSLHCAALSDYGETEILGLLLDAGAEREVKNKAGLTPAAAALRFDFVRLAARLDAKQYRVYIPVHPAAGRWSSSGDKYKSRERSRLPRGKP